MKFCKRPLKYKTALRFLTVISLILIIVNSASYFLSFSASYTTYDVRFVFPSFLSWISIVLNLIPALLFVVFTFTGSYTRKINPIIPIFFSILAVRTLYYLFVSATKLATPFTITSYAIEFIAYVLLLITSITCFGNKYLTIIPTVICLAIKAVYLFSSFSVMRDSRTFLFFFLRSTIYIGMIIFLIAFLLFALTNGVPSFVSNSKRNSKMIQKLSPEKALKLLNTKLDLGIITEENYKEERAKIIESL